MTLAKLSDGAKKLCRMLHTNEDWKELRIAFCCHSPGGDDKSETSTAKAHGMNLGTRYVFNQIETIATEAPPPKPQQRTGEPDPDLR